ncbi:MAG: hypothetical protein L6Q54_08965 [Leptospiraceae bacterium]|nr:hypothetical protein [Leptospiraceae bacterium]MCK6381365.1 hypothetical protein [Leptospiraceae bacterium]NUM42464.1 hypothetical protein [Leptospiraceae bacterium]
MKVRVVNLYKKIEAIDKDITELKNTRSRISIERDYSDSLKNSFDLEISKLENQKKEILSLKVLEAPNDLNKQKKDESFVAKNLYNTQEKELSKKSITIESPSAAEKKNEIKKQVHRY